jgi:hypothetical protein
MFTRLTFANRGRQFQTINAVNKFQYVHAKQIEEQFYAPIDEKKGNEFIDNVNKLRNNKINEFEFANNIKKINIGNMAIIRTLAIYIHKNEISQIKLHLSYAVICSLIWLMAKHI